MAEKQIKNKSGRNLYLKPADINDMEQLFQWANDKSVRKNSFHEQQISFEEHREWFLKLLQDQNEKQYILMEDGVPAGQVRMTACGETAVIHYSVSPDKRGQGYGIQLLRLAAEEAAECMPSVKILAGKVKPGNMASEKCFLKAGFEEKYREFELKLGGERS